MRRREVLGLPVVLWAWACGGEEGQVDANFQTSFQATSEVNASGHRHVLTVICADLVGGDVRYMTSEAADHTHLVTMTRSELEQLAAGQTVAKTISDLNHMHTWMLMKPATAC